MGRNACQLRYLRNALNRDFAPLGNCALGDAELTGHFGAPTDCGNRGLGGLLEISGVHAAQCSMATREGKRISLPRAGQLYGSVPRVETAILGITDYQSAAGARLRKVIKLLGLTYTEAADIMGVTKHVLNHWMVGSNPIQPYALYRLCRSRGIDFNYIFLGDWSGLPHRVGRAIEQELLASPDAEMASDRKDAAA